MGGIGPKLPIMQDEQDGFALTKTMKENIQQNFKNLIFTAPGERCMDINFGVGLRHYLFENMNNLTFGKIETKIREQVNIYMPFIEVESVEFNNSDSEGNEMMDRNMLSLSIAYKILPLNAQAILEVVEKIN